MYVCTYICMYVYMHVCVCVCMFVYTHTYVYVDTLYIYTCSQKQGGQRYLGKLTQNASVCVYVYIRKYYLCLTCTQIHTNAGGRSPFGGKLAGAEGENAYIYIYMYTHT